MLDNKITPGQVAAMRSDYRANDKSLSNQKKIYDMMHGFVLNINKQVDEVSRIYGKLPRTQTKLLNIPIKELRKRVTGSGEEAIAKSYLIEISNEIGKLSTGSSASVRELGEQAQKQWQAIHDESLSYNDLMKVLKATKDQANMRISSSDEAMRYTRQAIEGVGPGAGLESRPEEKVAPGSNLPAFDITRKPGETIPQFLERAKKGGSK
jgi:hypothetical protein